MEGNDQLAVEVSLVLHEIGAVRLGRFTLHSGRESPIYLDLRLLVSYPRALRLVAGAYGRLLAKLEYDVLAAIPYAALPIGVGVALQLDRPLVYPRKESKSYGTGRKIEGAYTAGQRAIIIEDVVTSGKSIVEAVDALRGAGLEIQDVVVLVDRGQGGAEQLRQLGCTLHAFLTLDQLLSVLEREGRIGADLRRAVLEHLAGE